MTRALLLVWLASMTFTIVVSGSIDHIERDLFAHATELLQHAAQGLRR